MDIVFEYKSFSFKQKENYFMFNKLPATYYSPKSPALIKMKENHPSECIFEKDEDSLDENKINQENFHTF